MMAFLTKVVLVANAYRDIVSTGGDILRSRQELMETASSLPEITCVKSENGTRYIPVRLPKKQGIVSALVSEEDYEKVSGISSKWRKSSSGYPIFVKRSGNKFITTYMHKLIYGDSAKHVNGDRMNNTRDNLVRSTRKRKATSETSLETEVLSIS